MRLIPILVGLIAILGVVLFLARGGPAPVAYAPAATILEPEAMGPLAPETTTQATLPENGTQHWTFAATAGDAITVQLLASGGSLAILPPDDLFPLVQVTVDPATDRAEICAQALAVGGTYVLQVQSGASGSPDDFGSYTIRIDRLGPPTDAPLSAVAETITTATSIMTVVRSPPCQGQ